MSFLQFPTIGESVVYFVICYSNAKRLQHSGDGRSFVTLEISMDIYDQICNWQHCKFGHSVGGMGEGHCMQLPYLTIKQ